MPASVNLLTKRLMGSNSYAISEISTSGKILGSSTNLSSAEIRVTGYPPFFNESVIF